MLTELIYINLVDLVHFSRFSHFFSLFFLSSQPKTGQLFLKMDLGFYAFYFFSLFLRFFSLHNPKKANCRNTDGQAFGNLQFACHSLDKFLISDKVRTFFAENPIPFFPVGKISITSGS